MLDDTTKCNSFQERRITQCYKLHQNDKSAEKFGIGLCVLYTVSLDPVELKSLRDQSIVTHTPCEIYQAFLVRSSVPGPLKNES
jgi:hypothetical protein